MSIFELFNKGCTYKEFFATASLAEQIGLEEVSKTVDFSRETKEQVGALKGPIYILVFAEPWCPDCVGSVPVVAHFAAGNDEILYSILPRSGHEEFLQENYPYEGKGKIPTMVFFDAQWRELGAYVEIPKIMKDLNVDGNQGEITAARKAYRLGQWAEEIAREFLSIIKSSQRSRDSV